MYVGEIGKLNKPNLDIVGYFYLNKALSFTLIVEIISKSVNICLQNIGI